MSGPWEDFSQEQGPWSDYTPQQPTGPELRQGKAPGMWDTFKSMFTDPHKEAAKATEALVNAEALKIRPSTAHEYHDSVKKVLEMKPDQKAKRDQYMSAIKKFNDTGVEDGWMETFWKSVQRVPLQMQIAAGGLLQQFEETKTLAPIGTLPVPMQAASDLLDVIKMITDNNRYKDSYSIGKEIVASGKQKVQPLLPDVEPGSFKDVVSKASDSAINNLVFLAPSLVTGNPAIALAGMGLQSAGQGYAEQREGGSDPLTASLASLGYGASEVLTEFIPVGKYLKPGNSFVRRLVEAEFSEIPTEVVNTLVTDVIDKVTISPDMTFADAMNDVKETIMVTALSTIGLTGASHAVHRIAGETMPEGEAKTEFIRAKDEALDEGMTPQQAMSEGIKAAVQVPEGKAHVESVIAKVEAESKQEETPVPTEIDTEQLDSELNNLFADETASIEDLLVNELEVQPEEKPLVSGIPNISVEDAQSAKAQVLQEMTTVEPDSDRAMQLEIQLEQYNAIIKGESQYKDFQPEALGTFEIEDTEQTVLDSLKAINESLGEKGSIDLAPLVELGKTVWNEGKTKLEDFSTRMQERLGEAWESAKEFISQVYEDLKRILSSERGSISGEDISRSQKQDRGAKKRIRKVTGQVRISDLVREDEALRAAFKKAEQAGRAAYREGNKDGMRKAKEEIKALIEKGKTKKAEREAIKKDIRAIKRLATAKSNIDVEYQKQIRDLVEGLDFTKLSTAKQEKLQGLADFIESNGVPLGIPEKRIRELQRLSKTAIADMAPEDIKALREQLKHLVALGKLKAQLKYKNKERKRAELEEKILSTTNNIDPDVKPKDERFRDKVKVAGTEFYINTLHTPRVAEMADNFEKNGEQQKLIKMMGEAESGTISASMKRGIDFMDFLNSQGIEVIEEESDTDIRMMIVMRYREGARTQAEKLMEHYGINTLPVLTKTEEKIVGWIRADMEKNKSKLAATWEDISGEIFPEQDVYYLPLKYVKEEEIVPDTQAEGRGRTTHTFDGFSHKRRPGVQKLPRVGILQVYQEAVMEQEWFIRIQPVLEDIKSVVLTDEYKAKAGGVLYNWWKDQIDIMARRGWSASAQLNSMTSLMRATRHNINKAILGFKLSTIMMQPFAVFDGMAYVNAKVGTRAAARVLGEVTKSFLIPGMTKKLIAESEALQHRQGGELAITEELQRAKGETFKDKLTRNAFKFISQADLKTAAGVQEAVRKIFIEEGMSEAEAMKEAEFVMNMSQGSSDVAYRPHILASGEGARTWFTFQTFVLNRWGLIIHDIVAGNIKHGDIKKKLAGVISLGIIMMAGYSEDEAREWLYETMSGKEVKADNRSEIEKTFVNIISTMPFFGNIIDAVSSGRDTYPPAMQVVVKGAQGAKKAITGKDFETRLKGVLNSLESILSIGIGYPGTAQFFDLLERALIKDKK